MYRGVVPAVHLESVYVTRESFCAYVKLDTILHGFHGGIHPEAEMPLPRKDTFVDGQFPLWRVEGTKSFMKIVHYWADFVEMILVVWRSEGVIIEVEKGPDLNKVLVRHSLYKNALPQALTSGPIIPQLGQRDSPHYDHKTQEPGHIIQTNAQPVSAQ